ncbi:DUF6316 family protein [Microbulbifer elongatus]|uniref:DUF6316 family protein n=1 Tax=Microbulbifer elongatus TaxID=86173 RepID=UPI0034E23FC0
MQQYRRGEEGSNIPPRSDRYYKLGDDWYFNARGGKTFGPYPCKAEAEKAARQFLNPPQHYTGNVRPFGSLRAKRWRSANRW